MENDSVPVIFLNANTWSKLPAKILEAANVTVDSLPHANDARNDVIRKVAANVGK
jgi:hypothetical protein